MGVLPEDSEQLYTLDEAVDHIAEKYGVPRSVYSRMVKQESGGRDGAVSPKGASSAWQIMPETAKGLGIDPNDPLQAAEGGLRILRDNYKRFRQYAENEKHAWMMSVAGYHGSPRNVERDLKKGGYGLPDISDGAITTRNHVLKIFDGLKGEELDRSPLGPISSPTAAAEPLVAEQSPPRASEKPLQRPGQPLGGGVTPTNPSPVPFQPQVLPQQPVADPSANPSAGLAQQVLDDPSALQPRPEPLDNQTQRQQVLQGARPDESPYETMLRERAERKQKREQVRTGTSRLSAPKAQEGVTRDANVTLEIGLNDKPASQTYSEWVKGKRASQLASELGVDVDVVSRVLERFGSPTIGKSTNQADEEYYAGLAKQGDSNKFVVGGDVIRAIKQAHAANESNKIQLKASRDKIMAANPGLEVSPEMLETMAAMDAGLLPNNEGSKRLLQQRNDYIDWLTASGNADKDAVTKAFGIDKPKQEMSALEWAWYRNPMHGLFATNEGDVPKQVRSSIQNDLVKYGSLAEATKAYKQQEEERKFSKGIGQPSEAVKTAARYIAKIPSTILETGAIAADASPIDIAYAQVSGEKEGAGIKKVLMDAAEDWRNRVDKDLALGQNPAYKQDFIANELAEGVTQFAVQMIAAPLTGGASLAFPLAEGATAQFREADKAGAGRNVRLIAATVGAALAAPDVVLKAKYLGALSGATKLKFVENMTTGLFAKFSKLFGEAEAREVTDLTVRSFLKAAAANSAFGMAGEHSQEQVEDVGNKALAKATYKPELTWEDVFIPTEQERRGYWAAGIAGAFGGNVETVIERMSDKELARADKALAKAAESGILGQSDLTKWKDAVVKQQELRGKDLRVVGEKTLQPLAPKVNQEPAKASLSAESKPAGEISAEYEGEIKTAKPQAVSDLPKHEAETRTDTKAAPVDAVDTSLLAPGTKTIGGAQVTLEKSGDDVLSVTRVEVPEGERRQGKFQDAVQELMTAADKAGMTLRLSIAPDVEQNVKGERPVSSGLSKALDRMGWVSDAFDGETYPMDKTYTPVAPPRTRPEAKRGRFSKPLVSEGSTEPAEIQGETKSAGSELSKKVTDTAGREWTVVEDRGDRGVLVRKEDGTETLLSVDELSPESQAALRFGQSTGAIAGKSISNEVANQATESGAELKKVPVRDAAASAVALVEGPAIPRQSSAQKVVTALKNQFTRVSSKPVEEMSDDEVIDSIAAHTEAELSWWKKNSEGYKGFYTDDVKESNKQLQTWSEAEHGRKLTDDEVSLYHLVSAFGSPSANPVQDSSLGLAVLDKYLRTGKLTGLSPKQATQWETIDGKRKDTGKLKFSQTGDEMTPTRAQISRAYQAGNLKSFNQLTQKFPGTPAEQVSAAIKWLQTEHPYAEIAEKFDKPLKGPQAIKQSEYLTKDGGGYGVFGLTGTKLGSYFLNRTGTHETVTKDLWYARTMARYLGMPLTEGKSSEPLKSPWSDQTADGIRMRKLADDAWRRIGEKHGMSQAEVQQAMWDFEKRLWERLGHPAEDRVFVSDGLKVGEELVRAGKITPPPASATIGVAPLREGTIKKLRGASKAFAAKAYQDFGQLHGQIVAAFKQPPKSKFPGLVVHALEKAIGAFGKTSSNFEASLLPTVSGPSPDVKLYATLMAVLAPDIQQSVLVSTYDFKGKDKEIRLTFTSREVAEDFVANRNDVGIEDLSYVPGSKTVILLDINRFGGLDLTEFDAKYGQYIAPSEKRRATIEFIEENDYRRHVQEARSDPRRQNSGVAGAKLSALLDQAEAKLRKQGLWDEPGLKSAARSPGAGQLQEPGGVRGSDGLLAEPYGKNLGTRLAGSEGPIEVDGRRVQFTGYKPAQDLAKSYMESTGRPYSPNTEYVPLDKERAARIADAFDKLEHAPNDPKVRAAYDAMIEETAAQYKAILGTGLKVEFVDLSQGDPYAASPRLAILDVVENNHLYVFSTRDGFGSDESFDPSTSPLLAETEFKISGQTALANDLFRVVHDYFGHIKDGNGFRARGEENAWNSHARMYSPLARQAMTTETRGQNSWVNFGPHAEANKTASGSDTVYADQKAGLLPAWASETEEDGLKSVSRPAQTETKEFKNWFKDSKVVNENGEPLVVYRGEHGLSDNEFQTRRGSLTFGDVETANLYALDQNDDIDRTENDDLMRPRVTPVYLSIQNPVINLPGDPFIGGEELVAAVGEVEARRILIRHSGQMEGTPFWQENIDPESEGFDVKSGFKSGFLKPEDLSLEAFHVFDDPKAVAAFKKAGYDGAIHEGYGENSGVPEYRVFDLSQIKSAIGNNGNFDENEASILKSVAKPFYSQLERTIEQKMPAKATIAQIRGILNSPEIKKEELEWSGLNERLDDIEAQNAKAVEGKDLKRDAIDGVRLFISKDEVLDFVRENGVDVQEVVKGEGQDDSAQIRKELTRDSDGNVLRNGEKTRYAIELEGVRDWVIYRENEPAGSTKDSESEALDNVAGRLATWQDNTKYSTYTLPGGEPNSYRELLITMPPKSADTTGWTATRAEGDPASGPIWAVRDENGKWLMGIPTATSETAEQAIERVANGNYERVKSPNFQSSHFDEPNILAHVRFDDRTVDGKKTLHIAEIQSDWHQKARQLRDAEVARVAGTKNKKSEEYIAANKTVAADFGYKIAKGVAKPVDLLPLLNRAVAALKANDILGFDTVNQAMEAVLTHPDWAIRWQLDEQEQVLAVQQYIDARNESYALESRVPDAPFKKTWHELAFKKVLRYAVENGYDAISWDTGETQNERYDLSKQVDSITHRPFGNEGNIKVEIQLKNAGAAGIDMVVSPDGEVIGGKADLVGKRFEDVVGKDIAEKILTSTGKGRLEGDGLKISGQGMIGFYDKMLPTFVNKYTKKWGGKVEAASVQTTAKGYTVEPDGRGAYNIVRDNGQPVTDSQGDAKLFDNKKDAEWWMDSLAGEIGSPQAHMLEITPEMKASVENEGQPLFRLIGKDDARRSEDSMQLRRELESEEDIGVVFDGISGGLLHGTTGEWQINEHDAEVLRRLLALRTQARTGEAVEEGAFDGIVWSPLLMKNLVAFGRSLVAGVKPHVSEKQLRQYNRLLDMLDIVATKSKGQQVVYVYEDALPHERTHKEDLDAGRTSARALEILKANPLWAGSPQFNEAYGHVSETDRASELAAILANGEAKYYGLDKVPNFAANKNAFLDTWSDGIIETNATLIDQMGFETWAAQYPIVTGLYSEALTRQGQSNANNKTNKQGAAAKDQETGSPGAAPESGPQALPQKPPGFTLVEPEEAASQQLGPKTKLASLPETLRSYGIAAVDTAYTVYGDTEATADAVKIFENSGVKGSMQILSAIKDPDASHTILAGIVYDTLLNRSFDLQGAEAQEARLAADKFLHEFTVRTIKAGRFVRAIQLMQHSPAVTVLKGAETLAEEAHNGLSDDQIQNLGNYARDLEAAFAETQFYKKEAELLRKEMAELDARLTEALTTKQRARAVAGRRRIYNQAQARFGGEIAAAMAKAERMADESNGLLSPAHHGTPHVFKAEILIEKDGKREFIVGDIDQLPEVPKGATVVKKFPNGRMRLSAIGSGEGNAAYGHGLYFASQEKVADWYRDQLAGKQITYDGKVIPQLQLSFDDISPEDLALGRVRQQIGQPRDKYSVLGNKDFIEIAKRDTARRLKYAQQWSGDGQTAMQARVDLETATLKILDTLDPKKFGEKQGGARYKVDLKPAEDEYLDLDKGYNEQSQKVKDALWGDPETFIKKVGGNLVAFDTNDDPVSGEDIMNWKKFPEHEQDEIWRNLTGFQRQAAFQEYRAAHPTAVRAEVRLNNITYSGIGKTREEAIEKALEQVNGRVIYTLLTRLAIRSLNYGKPSQEFASNWLLEKGIRGNRYLDGDSRHKGKADHNFVLFSDKDVAIESVLKSVSRPNAPLDVSGFDQEAFYKERDAIPLVQDKDGKLLAPNGKVSNIQNHDLWRTIRAKAFLNFFGDWQAAHNGKDGNGVWQTETVEVSKAVDDNGEPMVMFHGTTRAGFGVVDPGMGQKVPGATFWTNDRGMARTYSGTLDEAQITDDVEDDEVTPHRGIYSAFLNIRDPHEVSFEGANWDGSREGQWSVETDDGEVIYHPTTGRGYFTDRLDAVEVKRLTLENGGKWNRDELHIAPAQEMWETTDGVVREAQRYKNDGAIIREVMDPGGEGDHYDPADVMVTFAPNQIKSIFNQGSFDPNEGAMLKSVSRPQTETAEFKRFFGDSKVVGENGEPLEVFHLTEADFDTFKLKRLGIHIGTAKAAADVGERRGKHAAFKSRPTVNDGMAAEKRPWPDRYGARQTDRGWVAVILPDGRHSLKQNERGLWDLWNSETQEYGPRPNTSKELAQQVLDRYTKGSVLWPAVKPFPTEAEAKKHFFQTRQPTSYPVGASTIPLYASIQNPVEIDDPSNDAADDLRDDLISRKVITWEEAEEAGLTSASVTLNAEIRKLLQSKGYDGAFYTNKIEDPGSISWVAFDPKQLKSAIGNRGTFDPAEGSILKSTPQDPDGQQRREFVDLLGTIGAGHLAKGLAEDVPYMPETLKAVLEAQFGSDVIGPIWDDVYAKAVEVRDGWLQSIAMENNRAKASRRREDADFEKNLEKTLGRKLPEKLTDKDVLDILGVSRDITRRQRAIEKMHRYASGVRKAAVSLELRQMILGLSETELEAVAAQMVAENVSPEKIYDVLEDLANSETRAATLFPDGYSLKAAKEAFARGKEIVDQAKQEVKDHKAAIAQETAGKSEMVKDAELAEIKAREKLQSTKGRIADEYEKIRNPKTFYAKKAYTTTVDLLRNLTLSAEMSFLLRQGGKTIRSEAVLWPIRKLKGTPPEQASPAFRGAVKTMLPGGDQAYATNIKAIENHFLYPEAVKMGMDFSTAGRLGTSQHIGEEQLQSEAIDRMVEFLNKSALTRNTIALWPKMIQRFDKSMAIFMDNMRMKQYERLSNELRDQGLDPKKDRKEFEELVRRINTSTARPNKFDNKAVQGAIDAAVASRFFLAPSYTVAKWQDMGADVRNVVTAAVKAATFQGLPKGTQKVMLKRAIASYSALSVQYAILAAALGALVSFDPDDDDFLKLKLRDYRYDLTQGNRAELKYIAKMVKHYDEPDTAFKSTARYLRTRLNVVPAFGMNAWYGKDVANKDFDLKDPLRWAGLIAPMTYMNAIGAYKQDGWSGVGGTLPFDFIGVTASVYPDRTPALLQQQIDVEKEKLKTATGLERKKVETQIKSLERQRTQAEKTEAGDGKKDSEKGIIGTVMTYAQAIGTDPVTAFQRMYDGQRIRRLDNGTIIVERMDLKESQAVKKARKATNEMRLDHTVPLQLGGDNTEGNLNLVTEAEWKKYTPIENLLGRRLRQGSITKDEAQRLMKEFKAGKITEGEIRAQ